MNISKDQIILIIIIIILIIIGGFYYFYGQKNSPESKLEILNSLKMDDTMSVEEKENILEGLVNLNKEDQENNEITNEEKTDILNSLK